MSGTALVFCLDPVHKPEDRQEEGSDPENKLVVTVYSHFSSLWLFLDNIQNPKCLLWLYIIHKHKLDIVQWPNLLNQRAVSDVGTITVCFSVVVICNVTVIFPQNIFLEIRHSDTIYAPVPPHTAVPK